MLDSYKTGKLPPKGVVVIPAKIRNTLDADTEDQLGFEKRDDEVIVRGIKKKSIMGAYGSLEIDLKEPLVSVRKVREQYRLKPYVTH